jgi:hypothetical protein
MVVPAELEKILGFSVEHCLMKVWRQSDVFFGGSNGVPDDELRRVDRAYARVDRAVSVRVHRRNLQDCLEMLR